MAEIIPAILEKDFKEIKRKLGVLRGLVKSVQLDIEDGVFVKNTTWPFLPRAQSGGDARLDDNFLKIINEEEGMPHWQDFDFEIDLMVTDAVENFDLYTKLGAKKIIFHIEAVSTVEEFRNFLEGIDLYTKDDLEVGLALNPRTPTEKIFPLVSLIDFVQFMGNDKIGHKGISLDERVYGKIEEWREKFPDIPVAVDIGVNADTAPRLILAGAEKLVIGSAIFESSDIIKTIKKFQNL
jgi:ribulose-phosphate 3-epimerase